MHQSIVELMCRNTKNIVDIIKDFVGANSPFELSKVIETYLKQCNHNGGPLQIDEDFEYWYESIEYTSSQSSWSLARVSDNFDKWNAAMSNYCENYEGLGTLFKILGVLIHHHHKQPNCTWEYLRFFAFRLTLNILLAKIDRNEDECLRLIDGLLFFLPKQIICCNRDDDKFCIRCYIESGVYISSVYNKTEHVH